MRIDLTVTNQSEVTFRMSVSLSDIYVVVENTEDNTAIVVLKTYYRRKFFRPRKRIILSTKETYEQVVEKLKPERLVDKHPSCK